MEVLHASFLGFFALLISLSVKFFIYKEQKRNKNLPPGRTGLPVIGESLQFFFSGKKGNPEKFIFDRIAKYSSYVFRTSLFGSPAVVFCGLDGNKFLFTNENKLVQAWWPSSFDKIFATNPNGTTPSQDEAVRFRRMLLTVLKPEELHRYIGIMDQIAQSHFASDWENKDKVMVFSLTRRYTFRLACRLFLSVEDTNHVAKFEQPFGVLVAGLLSVPIDFPGTPFSRAIKASKFIKKELLAIIKQRKIDLAEGKASPNQDILSHMLLTCDEDGVFMTEGSVASKILGVLVAGLDTASSACASIVKYLAELPEIYKGVYEEQKQIANSKAEGELLDWEDIKKMKYSWNVACEALRLAPPVQGAFKEAMTDFTYDGFSISKGWKIYWSTHSTHINPRFFTDPLKFDPSRHEGSGPAPYTFVPFSGGPRICPGKDYARLEILVFMHHLVKRFKWEKMIPDEKIVVDPMPNPEKGLPVYLYPH